MTKKVSPSPSPSSSARLLSILILVVATYLLVLPLSPTSEVHAAVFVPRLCLTSFLACSASNHSGQRRRKGTEKFLTTTRRTSRSYRDSVISSVRGGEQQEEGGGGESGSLSSDPSLSGGTSPADEARIESTTSDATTPTTQTPPQTTTTTPATNSQQQTPGSINISIDATIKPKTASNSSTSSAPLNLSDNNIMTAANTGDSSNSTATATASTGSRWTEIRKTIFPIYDSIEVRKFLLIGSIKFFIILALTLTRDTKDTLVVTQCGAEAIAFLKIYGVLPAATAFIALYSKMSDVMGKKTLFYSTCIPFFAFFAFFDAFIYPNADTLQPTLASVQAFLPGNADTGGMAVLANILSHWTSALFYIVSEIYSSVSVGLLFWQFANDVVNVDQAKRFYPLFAQMSGLAPVLAGQYVVRYASKAADFGSSMHRLTAAVSFAGVMICFFYNVATKYVERTEGITLSDEPSSSTSGGGGGDVKKKKKPKMSMAESIKFLASSQYLRLIAALVLGYGLSINFTEVMWKSLVKKQYPNPLDYQRFMGNFSSAVGLATCIVIMFGVQVIRLLGWRVGAMATPATMALLAAPFFACILMGLDSPTRLHIAVILGTIQSLLSKTSKYALFDPTTQMAYIPLDPESKVKGKAAIDVLGSRIGKSGGSFIQQVLVFMFGNIINAAPVVGVIFYSVLFAWMSAASKLSTLFVAQTEMDKVNQQTAKVKKTE